MIAAPLTVGVHSIHIVIHLAAVIAVTGSVMVNAGAIVFEALMAGIAIIGFCTERRAESKYQAAG
jgi:hypothetical protein